jgi:hypothetical protein
MSKDRETHTVFYPEHALDPEDLINFIELPWFSDSWEDLALTDDDLSALQIVIMCDPNAGKVIQGTGGLRKLRYSPEAWNTGKSGALRACYVYFEKYGVVLLSLVFKKAELEDISPAGRKAIKKAVERIESQLKQQLGF